MTIERILKDQEDALAKLNDWYERVFACIVGNDAIPPEMVLKLNRVCERRKAKIHAQFVQMVEQM